MHVVVDPAFGDRLREIPFGEPAWIADTPVNRQTYEVLVPDRNPGGDYVHGFTIFKVDNDGTQEDWLASELKTIDLHHG